MNSFLLILMLLSWALAMPTNFDQIIQSKSLPNCPKELRPFSAHGLNPSAIRLRAIGPWTWVTKKGKSFFNYKIHG